ncbi:MAG: hybrid sensor histidine kinase/response regulator [Chloroflexi bacterium]|nr:hybrid sensor histidine kinase/response regulator [Chloroflexota bacterium]MCL5275075.1 hybrid sensor histidine kinase/response regulator [Chloroflexota bacterium]
MQEHLFSSLPGSAKYQSEVDDLRREITQYTAVVVILVGWGMWGFATSLLQTSIELQLPVLMAASLVGLGALALIMLNSPRRWKQTRWVFGSSMMAASFAYLLVSREPFMIVWGALACVVTTLLLGTTVGWAGAAVLTLGVIWLVATQSLPNLPVLPLAAQVAAVVAPLWVATLLMQIVSHLLFRRIRWMTEGYELAMQQSDELREQKAQLAGALKSLGQTSFTLARANEQLEIMVRYAEDARRSKQEFAANISHELRTPLNLIIGFSDVILHTPATYNVKRLPPGLLADIHVINRNAQHLLKLVNDILDLSQMDVNYMTIAREPVNIAEFIKAAIGDFSHLIEERGLGLTLDIEPGLPDVYADRTRIRQVLLNLINNALRFTESGGIAIRARCASGVQQDPAHGERAIPSHQAEPGVNNEGGVRSARPNPKSDIVISVADTGVGIAEADLARIFEPFAQLDGSIHRRHSGTGLGLTISKRFVELHGGRIWVESKPGVGSTFHFSLPMQPVMPETLVGGSMRRVHRHEVGTLAVVERNPLLSRLLERYLQGISITHVRAVEDLVTLSRSNCPEAVLINDATGAVATPFDWPDELRRVPAFRCYFPSLPGAGSTLVDGREPPSDRRSAGLRHLVMPIVREQLYETVSDMLAAANQAAGRDEGRPARLLVVEDDGDTLALLCRMLRAAPAQARRGFTAIIPVEARSGEQALDLLLSPDSIPFDGLVLDIKLSAVSGFDVLREVERADNLRALPICVVSGQAIWGESVMTPFLTLSRRDGFTARELTQAIAALMQIALPGLEVAVRDSATVEPSATTPAIAVR